MSEYIEFSLLDNHNEERNVKMNADDANEVYVWKDKWRGQPMKKPYWNRCVISKMTSGYNCIRITDKQYRLHRVCYYAHNSEWDIYNTSTDNSIDHIDRDKTNNHISNLRQATASQNQENRIVKGYSYDKINKNWRAEIMKNGRYYHKICRTEEEAIDAREKLKATYHTFAI